MGLIYLDACLLIYLREAHPVFGPRVRSAIQTATDVRFVVSALVQMECLVGPIKRADKPLQRAYEALFAQFENVALPDAVFLLAAELRGRFGVRTPDALHLACAQHHGCSALWTNDDRLASAGHGLAGNVIALP